MKYNRWLNKGLPSLNPNGSNQDKIHRMRVKNAKLRENDLVNLDVKHYLLLDLFEDHGIPLTSIQIIPLLPTDECYEYLHKKTKLNQNIHSKCNTVQSVYRL